MPIFYGLQQVGLGSQDHKLDHLANHNVDKLEGVCSDSALSVFLAECAQARSDLQLCTDTRFTLLLNHFSYLVDIEVGVI